MKKTSNKIEYVIFEKVQIKANLKIIKNFYLHYYDDQYVRAIENTQYMSLAIEGDAVSGALRIITDGARYALIVDFFVEENKRKSGIGKKIMNNTTSFLKKKGINNIMLSTYRKPAWLEDFYTKLGFVRKKEEIYMMFKGIK